MEHRNSNYLVNYVVKLLSLTFKYENNKQFVFYSTIPIKISNKYTTSCLKSIKNNKVDRNLCAYTSRFLRDHNPFYDNNCYEQQFRSPRVSSSIAIIIRGAARKSMIEVRGAARGDGNEVAAVRPLAWCSTGEDDGGLGEAGRGGRAGSGELF